MKNAMATRNVFVLLLLNLIVLSQPVIGGEPRVLQYEKPALLEARKLQKYEVVPGTVIPLALLETTQPLAVAQVTRAVKDFYGNVTIPAGSRVIGRPVGKGQKEREEVLWYGLQISGEGGTLLIDPPLRAGMLDGTYGIEDFSYAQPAAALVDDSFIVPR